MLVDLPGMVEQVRLAGRESRVDLPLARFEAGLRVLDVARERDLISQEEYEEWLSILVDQALDELVRRR